MHRVEMDLAGRKLVLETGRLAKQAGGAVLVSYGDSRVLATATASANPREGIDFFPLTVDYEERHYAVGKIPGSWARREGRASEKAILSGRIADRAIRPLFPDGFRNDVQVIITVLCVEQGNAPDILGLIAASAALSVSDIPFGGPVGAALIGYENGQYQLNPLPAELEKTSLNLVVAGTAKAINMVEAQADELSEEIVLGALEFGHDEIRKIVALQEELARLAGKPKREVVLDLPSAELQAAVSAAASERLKAAVNNPDKLAREASVAAVRSEVSAEMLQNWPDQERYIHKVLDSIFTDLVRAQIMDGIRPDGRSPAEIRPISVEVGVLPRTHGTGLFTRGQTQVLTIATLGTMGDMQQLDGLSEEESKRYMHHYNFPPFSVGETRPVRGPSRRDIGHGALAEKALELMIPAEEEFPYTVRLVSEVLESNGSSSMASVCGSTLALLDAGVPIKAPVAGVAMGLITSGDRVQILTDIQGIEDHEGDMDFKVAGTRKGINAIQMDIKVTGLGLDILKLALAQAREGRLFILDKMEEVISAPRPDLSPYAPRIYSLQIDVEKIRDVIGPGGKVIQKIQAETGTKVDIEQDGRVFIAAVDAQLGERALKMIEAIVREVEVGVVYMGRITRVEKYGAFVEILPGKEGLVHISQLDIARVNNTEDIVSVGDEILVKVTEIDRMGRINLSRREVLLNEQR
ncbi:MAG: polyribonucleotide nucleotidyltransferase [Symbiobacteriaceae bacterium]|nr:polyribonucleotide nucleotidyltransferase [Symbiobacteriaceae bacterium]